MFTILFIFMLVQDCDQINGTWRVNSLNENDFILEELTFSDDSVSISIYSTLTKEYSINSDTLIMKNIDGAKDNWGVYKYSLKNDTLIIMTLNGTSTDRYYRVNANKVNNDNINGWWLKVSGSNSNQYLNFRKSRFIDLRMKMGQNDFEYSIEKNVISIFYHQEKKEYNFVLNNGLLRMIELKTGIEQTLRRVGSNYSD